MKTKGKSEVTITTSSDDFLLQRKDSKKIEMLNEEDNHETIRTIEEVLDIESGQIIETNKFYKNTEDYILKIRRRIEEAIVGLKPPKYQCVYCKQ